MTYHAPSPGHRPGRRGHRVLAYLATHQRATFMGLMGVTGDTETRKLKLLLAAMQNDGLTHCGRPNATYRITPLGEAALGRLQAGETVPTGTGPKARIFTKEHASA